LAGLMGRAARHSSRTSVIRTYVTACVNGRLVETRSASGALQ
jgi:hypothetical protein